MNTLRQAEQPTYFPVGTVLPKLSQEQMTTMSEAEILEKTMEWAYGPWPDRRDKSDADGLWMDFGESASNTEATQAGWQINYAKDVLPNQPDVLRYCGLHSAKSLLTSPHFYTKDEVLNIGDNDLGLLIHHNATEGFEPFRQMAADHARPDLQYKIDVPEVAMSMVYFGRNSATNGIKNMVLHGLAETIRERSPHGFATAFAKGIQTFNDKYYEPYQQATFNQIRKILTDLPQDQIEFQISAPVSHSMAVLLYQALQHGLVSQEFYDDSLEYLAGTVAEMFNRIPKGVPRVLHACQGDINPDIWWGKVAHLSKKNNVTNQATVNFINKVVELTKEDHRPRLVHAVITPAGAAILETDSEHMLEPFRGWPEDIRFAAGMLDSSVSAEHNARSYRKLGEYVGYLPDVAHACGLGRQRNAAVALQKLHLAHDTVKLLRGTA